jgi:hypothetical protein
MSSIMSRIYFAPMLQVLHAIVQMQNSGFQMRDARPIGGDTWGCNARRPRRRQLVFTVPRRIGSRIQGCLAFVDIFTVERW